MTAATTEPQAESDVMSRMWNQGREIETHARRVLKLLSLMVLTIDSSDDLADAIDTIDTLIVFSRSSINELLQHNESLRSLFHTLRKPAMPAIEVSAKGGPA